MKFISVLLLLTLIFSSCYNREQNKANSASSKFDNILIDHLLIGDAAYTIGFLQGNSFSTNDVAVYIGYKDQSLLHTQQLIWNLEQMAKGSFQIDDALRYRTYYFANDTESLIGKTLKLNLFDGSKTIFSAKNGFTIPRPTNLKLYINENLVYDAINPERRIHYSPLADRLKITWQNSQLVGDRLFLIVEAPTTDKKASMSNADCFLPLNNVKDVQLTCDLCPDPDMEKNIRLYENYRIIELQDDLEEYLIPNCLFEGLEKRNIWFNLRRVNFEVEEVNSEKYFMYNISQDHLMLETI